MDPDHRVARSLIERFAKKMPQDADLSFLLADALGLRDRDLISLVGAGGKTTLMFGLAGELSRRGKKVVTSTTTRIMEPKAEETPCLFVDANEEKIVDFVRRSLDPHRHVTVARERIETGKLKGISPGLVDALWSSCGIDHLIVEADGAAGRPIKAPREFEPVIPPATTLIVALLGLDGLGKKIEEGNVFQPERVSKLTGIPLGAGMTSEGMSVLVTHPEGLFKGAPPAARVVAFLNKVDAPGSMLEFREVARRILEKRHPGVERVILGQLRKAPPVVEVIFP